MCLLVPPGSITVSPLTSLPLLGKTHHAPCDKVAPQMSSALRHHGEFQQSRWNSAFAALLKSRMNPSSSKKGNNHHEDINSCRPCRCLCDSRRSADTSVTADRDNSSGCTALSAGDSDARSSTAGAASAWRIYSSHDDDPSQCSYGHALVQAADLRYGQQSNWRYRRRTS